MKWKKYGSTGNKDGEHNTWCTRKGMGMSTINGSQNQGYHMQDRRLKIIGQGIQVKTYKEGGQNPISTTQGIIQVLKHFYNVFPHQQQQQHVCYGTHFPQPLHLKKT